MKKIRDPSSDREDLTVDPHNTHLEINQVIIGIREKARHTNLDKIPFTKLQNAQKYADRYL